MDIASIESLLSKKYNIIHPILNQLDGYESLNYRVTTTSGEKFVLKIHTDLKIVPYFRNY